MGRIMGRNVAKHNLYQGLIAWQAALDRDEIGSVCNGG